MDVSEGKRTRRAKEKRNTARINGSLNGNVKVKLMYNVAFSESSHSTRQIFTVQYVCTSSLAW